MPALFWLVDIVVKYLGNEKMRASTMRVLVTGANGYIGRHVTRSLLERGHEVVVAVRNSDDLTMGCEAYEGNILESTQHIFRVTGRPDVLIHLAWEDGFVHQSDKHLGNVHRHAQFIENMLAGGLKQIVTAGTAHEIGFHIGPVDDQTATRPMHPYGIAKNYLRDVQWWLCQKYGAINQWVRCYYIWGDDRRNNSLFTKILKAEDDGDAEFSLNSGEILYDFIRVEELGEMIGDVAEQTAISGVINCSSGDPVSLKTMVLRFIEQNKLNIKPVWGKFPLRPYDSRAIWGDTTKIEKIRSNRLID